MTDPGEARLIEAAKSGEEAAFVELTSPHRRALHVHCYRLLGSLHDADDALQETLLNAWRALPDFELRAPLRAWLYRIATNVSLRMIERRSEPALPPDAGLEPYPDDLFNDTPSGEPGPEARAILSEGVGLAFIAAMRLLPPRQRAVLVLRDALGWRAAELRLLGDSVASVNSALQRARAALDREQGGDPRPRQPASGARRGGDVRTFQEAWARVDVEAIVGLLTDDALLTMPPVQMRFEGAGEIRRFFATEPVGGQLDRIKLVGHAANGQPGLASYADEGEGVHRPYGVMVLALEGQADRGITEFPAMPPSSRRSGCPVMLDPGGGPSASQRQAPARFGALASGGGEAANWRTGAPDRPVPLTEVRRRRAVSRSRKPPTTEDAPPFDGALLGLLQGGEICISIYVDRWEVGEPS
ncbi:MAG: RNA polymerase subunit sigma-70 [Solirubrobacterales bacterium]